MKKISGAALGLIASLFFLVAIVLGFFLLWSQSKSAIEAELVDEKYTTVEIESVKSRAAKILSPETKDNLSGQPISTPDSSQFGRTNPFQAPEI